MEDKMLDLPEDMRKAEPKRPYKDLSVSVPNTTILPDRLMKTFAPVIIIRNPVKQIESWYSASRVFGVPVDDPDFELGTTYKFSRRVFDYFTELYRGSSTGGQNGNGVASGKNWPIVIDGDDLINDTEGICKRFCEIAGLDPAGVIYKWEERKEKLGAIDRSFAGKISKSEGVQKNLSPKIYCIKEASRKWIEAYDIDVAKALARYVEEAMEDYQYLHQFRLHA